jgi:hypothetical protein
MTAFAWNIPNAADAVIGAGAIADDALVAINAAFVANQGATGALWQVATYQATSPKYIILKRQNGAAGRIVIFGQNGSTAHANACYTTPTASALYIGYSATSTSDTIDTSWLSGAPLSASDYMKGMHAALLSAATYRCNYAEFSDGVYILFSYTGGASPVFGAGSLIEDTTGAFIPTVQGAGASGSSSWATATANSGALWPVIVGSDASYTHNDAGLQVRVGGSNRLAFRAVTLPSTAVLAKLIDTSNTKIFFMPIPIVHSNTDTTYAVLGKVRQVAFGPACDRETRRSEGAVNAYGHQYTTAAGTSPGVWFVDVEL